MRSFDSAGSIAGLRMPRRRRPNVLVLDSDLLTIIQRAAGADYQTLVRRLRASNDDVYVTIVSFEEQMRGWMAYLARGRDIGHQIVAYAKLHELIHDFCDRPILDFTDRAGVEFQRLRQRKVRIGTMDLKIATIVMAHGATLLSRNLSDFERVPGLRVEKWI